MFQCSLGFLAHIHLSGWGQGPSSLSSLSKTMTGHPSRAAIAPFSQSQAIKAWHILSHLVQRRDDATKNAEEPRGKKGLQASAVRYHMQVLTASTSSKYFKYKLFGTTYGILWLQGSYLWQYRWDAVSAFLRHFWLGKTKNRTVSTLRLRWRAESSLEFWRILENLTGYGPDIAKINQHHLKSSKICLLCLLSIFSAYSFWIWGWYQMSCWGIRCWTRTHVSSRRIESWPLSTVMSGAIGP